MSLNMYMLIRRKYFIIHWNTSNNFKLSIWPYQRSFGHMITQCNDVSHIKIHPTVSKIESDFISKVVHFGGPICQQFYYQHQKHFSRWQYRHNDLWPTVFPGSRDQLFYRENLALSDWWPLEPRNNFVKKWKSEYRCVVFAKDRQLVFIDRHLVYV